MNDPIQGRDVRLQFWAQSTRPELEGRLGTTFSLSNGYLGLRGFHEEMPSWGRCEFYVSGTYSGGPASLLGFHDPDHILTHPKRMGREFLDSLGPHSVWTLPNLPCPLGVRLSVGGVAFEHEKTKVLSNERLIEMDQGVMRRCLVFRDSAGRRTRVESRRLVSFANRHLFAMRYAVTPLDHDAAIDITPFINEAVTNTGGVVMWKKTASAETANGKSIVCITGGSNIEIAIVQQFRTLRVGSTVVLETLAIAGELPLAQAQQMAAAEMAKGFDAVQAEHVARYRAVADASAVAFDDNPDTVQGFAFGQMHMHMAFPTDNRVGVPIKGLTGHGYRFANFWDMDFHMFPYYLMTKPRQARLLLEYRYNQLDAYRANAKRWGARGAQVPWETQARGEEVTADWLCLQEREIHISADASYMFKLYDELTPDHDALVKMGAEFIFETARFYASRVRWSDARKAFELPDIGCPDQYHTFADNNVFISRLAKWNLQYALELAADTQYAPAAARVGLAADELAQWKKIVDQFYIIGPNADGIIEEFDGYFALSSDIEGICETYCRHSQAVKQPDVVAMFGPFEQEFPLDIRRKNWQYYAHRTLHGSSLSLPGMAYAAARCGLNDEAMYYLHKSCRMDLDDVNMDSDRGVHLTGGALQWFTLVFGFGGLTPRRDALHLEPNLPRQYSKLDFTVHWQFQRLHVRLRPGKVELEAAADNTRPVMVKLGGESIAVPPATTVSR